MPLPIISVAAMRDWEERTWATGVTVEDVMLEAGKAVAREAEHLTRNNAEVLFLAGPGNNGGDVRIASQQTRNRDGVLLEFKEEPKSLDAVGEALGKSPDLIVDGLFGIGINRKLNENWQKLIDCINSSGCPVLSVDIPSGLNGDTGEPMGAAIKATRTITLGAPKTGFMQPTATSFTGCLVVAHSIGLLDELPASEHYWVTRSDMYRAIPSRSQDAHKGDFGHVGIIAGSTGYHGAAVLAARAALRARPGLVSVYTPAYAPVAAQLQSAMVHPWSKDTLSGIGNCSAFIIGPGLAGPDVPEGLIAAARVIWSSFEEPVIADASALDWLANTAPHATAMRAITPHAGEAARLLGKTSNEINTGRTSAVRLLAEMTGSHVVLKGRHTLIGNSQGPLMVNSTGNPGLAQGGSGDVLAGFLGGLAAQPALSKHFANTLAYGVWKHGFAADRLQQQSGYWGMDDLIEGLGQPEFD